MLERIQTTRYQKIQWRGQEAQLLRGRGVQRSWLHGSQGTVVATSFPCFVYFFYFFFVRNGSVAHLESIYIGETEVLGCRLDSIAFVGFKTFRLCQQLKTGRTTGRSPTNNNNEHPLKTTTNNNYPQLTTTTINH